MHRVRPVPHRLLGRRAPQCIHLDRVEGPVDGPAEVHETPTTIEDRTRTSITATPVRRVRSARQRQRIMGLILRRSIRFPASMRPSVWAVISVHWCARSTTASRWCVWTVESPRRRGISERTGQNALWNRSGRNLWELQNRTNLLIRIAAPGIATRNGCWQASLVGCFYCLDLYPPAEITEWTGDDCALCPYSQE